MHNDFDVQWQLRCHALAECRNPLSDDRWRTMVAQACGTENRERRTASKHIWSVSAAAAVCLILLVTGALHLQGPERPSNIDYSGQSVRFICNNQCNAQSTLAYFDSYIGKKGNL